MLPKLVRRDLPAAECLPRGGTGCLVPNPEGEWVRFSELLYVVDTLLLQGGTLENLRQHLEEPK